jgi:hypothetical protein
LLYETGTKATVVGEILPASKGLTVLGSDNTRMSLPYGWEHGS